jgi:hypothetical protein
LTGTLTQAEKTLTSHYLDDGGRVAKLRPYVGTIKQKDLDETRKAARSVLRAAKRGAHIPMGTVARIFQLVKVVRVTAVDPNSMLMRNHRIGSREHAKLLQWVDDMEWTLLSLFGILEGRDT